ncbi:hypothetical protein MNBD_ACTINO02-2482, partial [hydrothermal vent metagenome]
MPLPEAVTRLIDAASRRIRLERTFDSVVVFVAIAGALSALLLGVARIVVVVWAEPVALGLFLLAIAGSVLVGLMRRPSRAAVALAVDQRLGGADRVATALDLVTRGQSGRLVEAQVTGAATWAD